MSDPAAGTRPISDYLGELLDRLFARSENFVAGRYWMLEALFLAVLFTVLFSGGIDPRLVEINNNYPAEYFQKIEHPLKDVAQGADASRHEAKLNFRLTVPVLLHLLRVPSSEHWVLPALSAAAVCVLILTSCLFAFDVTRDRVCGLYAALAVASTYIGSFAFTFYYDAIAVAQLAIAMLPRLHWSIAGLLVFTAAFTDERALLASPLLLIHALASGAPSASSWPGCLNPRFWAIIAGMAGYCFVRWLLMHFIGLSSPHEGTGLNNLMENFPHWHAGAWFALKGGWILVCLAMLCLWQRGHPWLLAAFALSIGVVIGGGFMVQDILRSTAYVFPAVFVALTIISAGANVRVLRICCLAAFALSAIAGNYNVWLGQITWFQPLAAKIIYRLLEFTFGGYWP